MILQALNDNSLAVVRAMRRFRSETEQEKVERVDDGSFLIDRLEAGLVVDQDLAVVLLDLRRRLIDEHGDTPVNRPSESKCAAAAHSGMTSKGGPVPGRRSVVGAVLCSSAILTPDSARRLEPVRPAAAHG